MSETYTTETAIAAPFNLVWALLIIPRQHASLWSTLVSTEGQTLHAGQHISFQISMFRANSQNSHCMLVVEEAGVQHVDGAQLGQINLRVDLPWGMVGRQHVRCEGNADNTCQVNSNCDIEFRHGLYGRIIRWWVRSSLAWVQSGVQGLLTSLQKEAEILARDTDCARTRLSVAPYELLWESDQPLSKLFVVQYFDGMPDAINLYLYRASEFRGRTGSSPYPAVGTRPHLAAQLQHHATGLHVHIIDITGIKEDSGWDICQGYGSMRLGRLLDLAGGQAVQTIGGDIATEVLADQEHCERLVAFYHHHGFHVVLPPDVDTLGSIHLTL